MFVAELSLAVLKIQVQNNFFKYILLIQIVKSNTSLSSLIMVRNERLEILLEWMKLFIWLYK